MAHGFAERDWNRHQQPGAQEHRHCSEQRGCFMLLNSHPLGCRSSYVLGTYYVLLRLGSCLACVFGRSSNGSSTSIKSSGVSRLCGQRANVCGAPPRKESYRTNVGEHNFGEILVGVWPSGPSSTDSAGKAVQDYCFYTKHGPL